ncbi:hypothetical protein [Wolbachia endosymbiont (group E) of Neria commutata]|uniref:hypothetical protein n=1 Tax=Wolbachia endosymbiont (group E) of Neria commutata TaxID=3066149 RepID=UPI003133496A
MKHNSSAEQVLNAIIEEIKFNRTQVIEEGTVNAELIEAGIRSVSTSLGDINISHCAGMNRNP